MPPETNETPSITEHSSDLFAEPRDHANQWDVTTLWPDQAIPTQEEREHEAEGE